MESNNQKENIVMTGGSFTTSDDTDSVITSQPRKTSRMETGSRAKAIDAGRTIFDDAHCERDWANGLCQCKSDDKRHCCCYVCCWPYLKYIIATRLGETPFMALIPCAVFALRIKVRTLFGIKGSLVKDFFTSLCCEPCAVCQMNRELDNIGM